jgi:hypothetical protein
VAGRFPTQDAYNLIFLTAAMISVASIALALALARRKIIAGQKTITRPQ